MPKVLTLDLTQEQRAELLDHRDHSPHPYLRERCAALLKHADGESLAHIARTGRHRVYAPDAL